MNTRAFNRLRLVCAGAAAMVLAGCNIGVPVMYAITGPPKIQAVYELDASRPTVILVDDPRSRVPRRELRLLIGQTADETLLKNKAVEGGKLIGSRSALSAATSSASSQSLSIVDVGRRVGAEVVIYAEVTDWRLALGNDGIAPSAALSITVYDTLANQRLWPEEGGQVLMTSLPAESGFKQGDRPVLERMLAKEVGLRLAQVFYEHAKDQLQNRRGEKLGG